MRTRLPTSQAALRFRISILDFVCIVASPLLALFLGESYFLNIAIAKHELIATVAFYCTTWIVFSLIFFFAFRLYDGLAHHFSVHDALDVVKAVLFADLSTFIVFFTFSRLEGIPRSAIIYHALILTVGLIGSRIIVRTLSKDEKHKNGRPSRSRQNIILVGATRMSGLYVKLLEACLPDAYRVIAILDGRPQFIGRSMSGIRVLSAPHQLDSVIEEFHVHGVNTDRVIIGDDEQSLDDNEFQQVQRACEKYQIKLDYLPKLIGLGEPPPATGEILYEGENVSVPDFEVPRYFRYKQVFDFFAALVILVFLLPLLTVASLLTLLDVGSPVLFWQQRVGQSGRRFMLQKFRTLRAPYDWRGRPVPQRKDLSFVGKLLRQTRLDELPQLLNVLVGDMALIGPRPLLPEDQPLNPVTRLMVRPGITGWAQVNGGKFLTPEQKDEYDEYYIRNASLWFDLRIVFMTLKVLFRFGGRSDHEVAASQLVGFGKSNDSEHAKTAAQRPTKVPTRRVESPSFNLATPEGSLRASSITDRQAPDSGRRRSVK